MIAVHVPMRQARKSSYLQLVQYLLDTRNKRERVGAKTVTNCQSEEPLVAALEVLNTQALNRRSSADKTYHLIVSFRANEQPSADVLSDIEATVCAKLGFGDHQRVSVVHHDTNNLHIRPPPFSWTSPMRQDASGKHVEEAQAS